MSGRKVRSRETPLRGAQWLWQHQIMTPSLRPATREDLVAVHEIVQAAYTHYIVRIGRKPGPMLDDYAALIGEGQVHVAERDIPVSYYAK